MALQASGAISLTDIMTELRGNNPSRAYPISLGDADVLALAGKGSVPISLTDLYGKSSGAPAATVTSVSVSPTSASLSGGQTQQFTATVTGTNSPSQTVIWSFVSGVGSINSNGLYTAPPSTSSTQSAVIKATSTVDGTKSATASVSIAAAVPTVTSVTVSPSSATVASRGTQQFTATVNGTNNPSQSINWSTVYGSITSGGLYTAPAATTSTQSDTVTAISVADNSKSASASVTIPTLPVSATGVNDDESYDSVASGGTASAYPSVNPSGGNGTYTYQWSVVSHTGVSPILINPNSQTCTLYVSYSRNANSSFSATMQCIVSSNGGSVTVNNINGTASWYPGGG